MNNKTIILLLLGLMTGCKKEDSTLHDLSKGGDTYPKHWAFIYHEVDSIDAKGKPWFSPWPASRVWGGDFQLRSLNKQNTLYKRLTEYEDLGNQGDYHPYWDSVYVDPNTGIMRMTIYANYGQEPDKPDSLGEFEGRYAPGANRIYGYFKYRAGWNCQYCPTGARTRGADIVVQAYLY